MKISCEQNLVHVHAHMHYLSHRQPEYRMPLAANSWLRHNMPHFCSAGHNAGSDAGRRQQEEQWKRLQIVSLNGQERLPELRMIDRELNCGIMALSVERWTRDQEIVGSSLGWAHGVKTLGKVFTPMCHQAV